MMGKKKQAGARGPAKAESGPRGEHRERPEEGPEPAGSGRLPPQPRNREEGIRRLHEATDEITGVW
jgi:hypothetical protein